MVNDIEIKDEADALNNQTLSIKEIILRQIRKIGDLSCKEFTGGYWQKKPVKTGSGIMFSEVYHEDVREAYCNSVDFLIDLVYPMGDKELKDYFKEFEKFQEDIKEEDKKKEKKSKEVSEDDEIKQKLKLKRQSFRQINIMFERNNFWQGAMGYNE